MVFRAVVNCDITVSRERSRGLCSGHLTFTLVAVCLEHRNTGQVFQRIQLFRNKAVASRIIKASS